MATCIIAMVRALGGGCRRFSRPIASALAFQSVTTSARAAGAANRTARTGIMARSLDDMVLSLKDAAERAAPAP
jgi:hypothetical protein